MSESITSKVRSLNLPLGEYVVIGSGILDALGIRPAHDIDIAVTQSLHAQLSATSEWDKEERYGKIFLKRGDFELNPRLDWEDYPTTTEEAIATALLIDGVPFMNLEELKKFKRALGREKDAHDIARIESYEAARASEVL